MQGLLFRNHHSAFPVSISVPFLQQMLASLEACALDRCRAGFRIVIIGFRYLFTE